MVNTNKILTVSYGTFSCTLEGFDDSFGTMKAIAEYFRDLAADDRYFGAEPPTPDADMIARIAEREIARRVDAHQEDNTIVLRAEAPGESAQSAPSLAPVAAAATTAAAASHTLSEQASNASVEDEIDDAAALLSDVDSLSEENTESAPEALETPTAQDDYVESQEALEPEDIAVEQTEAPESVATKLARIRDVVAKGDSERDDETYTEDEHASASADEAGALTDDAASIEAAFEEAAPAEKEAQANEDTAAGEELLQEVEEPEDTPISLEAIAKAVAEETSPAGETPVEPQEQSAELSESKDEDDDLSALLEELSSDEPEAELSAPRSDAPEEVDAVEAKAEVEAEAEAEEVVALPARIVKIKKADLDAAVEAGILEEDEDTAQSTLSEEDEDELSRELAALEAEMHADAEGADTLGADLDQDVELDEANSPAAENLFSAQADESEAERIFEDANEKLAEEDGRNRRSTIAHLRAAVQATKAERALGGDLSAPGRDSEPYRDDLETVVRPRRPESTMARDRRPNDSRPAPLQLVAEQRVDNDQPEAPVRPRRITTPLVAPTGDGFANYAEDMGAHGLPEVLEAAASYMSFVEGQSEFSRIELMSKLGETDHAETSREDRMRSFGKLLRDGKIRKVSAGRFEVSQDIAYRPAS